MANAQAFESGWRLAADAMAQRRARKEALSDQEFQLQAERIGNELAANREMLSRIDRLKNPTAHARKVADLQQNLSDLRTLFHPDHRPDGIARFGHLITDKLGLTNPQKRIQAEGGRRAAGAAEDEQQAQALAAATPDAEADQLQQAQLAQRIKGLDLDWTLDWAKKHNVPDDAMRELTQHLVGVAASSEGKLLPVSRPFKGRDGSYYQTMRDSETGELIEESMPEGYSQPAPRAPRESDFQIGFARYLRERRIDPARATARDEARYRAIIHPPRPLRQLRDEAAKRKPKEPKKRHPKAAPPPYDWSADPSHQQPTPQAGPR